MKTCPKCKTVKPLGDFTVRSGKRGSWCLACNDANRKAWRARVNTENPEYTKTRRARWKVNMSERIALVMQAKEGPCTDCGRCWPAPAMDFDHVHGEKSNEVSTLLRTGASLDRIKREIAKCELVCACCHRLRTHARKGPPGPYSIY